MAKRDKLIEKLKSKPKDFTWEELVKVLKGFGYKQITGGKTGGSRVRFIHTVYPQIILHKPHPKPIIKSYLLNMIVEALEQEGLL